MSNIQIEFDFNGSREIVEAKNEEEFLVDIFQRYSEKINKNIAELFFLYNGDIINLEEKLINIAYRKNKISILVNEYEDEDKLEEVLKKSNDIICPFCYEMCTMNIDNYKIIFSNCKNGHYFSSYIEEIDVKEIPKIPLLSLFFDANWYHHCHNF